MQGVCGTGIERREQMKKRILALLMAACMVIGLAGCGNGGGNGASEGSGEAADAPYWRMWEVQKIQERRKKQGGRRGISH